jgi:HK97 gp10 family phage protein
LADKSFSREIKIYGNTIKDAEKGNDKSLYELAVLITAETKSLAPVDKGELKNSFMFKVEGSEGGFNDSDGEASLVPITGDAGNGEAFVGSNSDHAVPQEFGTRTIYPQPSLRPAVAIVEGQTLDIVKKQIDKAIDTGLRAGGNPSFEKEFKI